MRRSSDCLPLLLPPPLPPSQPPLPQADYVNEAYARMLRNDVRYRFVIDVQGSLIA